MDCAQYVRFGVLPTEHITWYVSLYYSPVQFLCYGYLNLFSLPLKEFCCICVAGLQVNSILIGAELWNQDGCLTPEIHLT